LSGQRMGGANKKRKLTQLMWGGLIVKGFLPAGWRDPSNLITPPKEQKSLMKKSPTRGWGQNWEESTQLNPRRGGGSRRKRGASSGLFKGQEIFKEEGNRSFG